MLSKSSVRESITRFGAMLIEDQAWLENHAIRTVNRSSFPIPLEEAVSEMVDEIFTKDLVNRFDIDRYPQNETESDDAYQKRIENQIRGYIGTSIRHRVIKHATRSQRLSVNLSEIYPNIPEPMREDAFDADERLDQLLNTLPDASESFLIAEIFGVLSSGSTYEEIERIYGTKTLRSLGRWVSKNRKDR